MIDTGFDAVERVAADSLLWRGTLGAARVAGAAWADSKTSAVLIGASHWLNTCPPPDRVRAGAVAAACLGAGHLAFLSVAPAYVLPALPRLGIVALVVAALGVAAAPRTFASAWDEAVIVRIFKGCR